MVSGFEIGAPTIKMPVPWKKTHGAPLSMLAASTPTSARKRIPTDCPMSCGVSALVEESSTFGKTTHYLPGTVIGLKVSPEVCMGTPETSILVASARRAVLEEAKREVEPVDALDGDSASLHGRK